MFSFLRTKHGQGCLVGTAVKRNIHGVPEIKERVVVLWVGCCGREEHGRLPQESDGRVTNETTRAFRICHGVWEKDVS